MVGLCLPKKMIHALRIITGVQHPKHVRCVKRDPVHKKGALFLRVIGTLEGNPWLSSCRWHLQGDCPKCPRCLRFRPLILFIFLLRVSDFQTCQKRLCCIGLLLRNWQLPSEVGRWVRRIPSRMRGQRVWFSFITKWTLLFLRLESKNSWTRDARAEKILGSPSAIFLPELLFLNSLPRIELFWCKSSL